MGRRVVHVRPCGRVGRPPVSIGSRLEYAAPPGSSSGGGLTPSVCRAYSTSLSALTSGPVIYPLTTIQDQTSGAGWTLSSGSLVVPASGYYEVTCGFLVTASAAAEYQLYVYQNGTNIAEIYDGYLSAHNWTMNGSMIGNFGSSDTLSIFVNMSTGSLTPVNGDAKSAFTHICKVG